MKFIEGRRLIEGLLNGLDSVDDGLRTNMGLDATLVNPLEVLDLTELKMALIPLTADDLDGRGFKVNLGRGRSGSGLGSPPSSTKNPMSPSTELSETLLFINPPSLGGCCCVDVRVLREDGSREKEGKRSIRGERSDDVSHTFPSGSYTGRGGGGGHCGMLHLSA